MQSAHDCIPIGSQQKRPMLPPPSPPHADALQRLHYFKLHIRRATRPCLRDLSQGLVEMFERVHNQLSTTSIAHRTLGHRLALQQLRRAGCLRLCDCHPIALDTHLDTVKVSARTNNSFCSTKPGSSVEELPSQLSLDTRMSTAI